MREFYKGLLEESMNKKEIRDDIALEDTSLFILTMHLGILMIAAEVPNIPLKKLVDTNLRIIWNCIKAK
jgi:hypothetical protein